MKRTLNILNRAYELGYDIDPGETIINALDKAENFIRDAIDYDRIEMCELSEHGYCNQSYCWSDGKDYAVNKIGEIFDCNYHYTAEDGVFVRLSDKKPVNWFDIPEGDERKEYGFIFAKEIDTDGQVVALCASF